MAAIFGSKLVRNNPNRPRYKLFDEDTLAGFIDYRVRDGQYWLVHTKNAIAESLLVS